MLTHGTYKLPDSEFKTLRISLNLKSANIKPFTVSNTVFKAFGVYLEAPLSYGTL